MLVSLEIASDGLLRSGGFITITMGTRGLITVASVTGPAEGTVFEGLRQNVGRMMR